MTAYYNEFDPKAAAWLRELIKQGHIADGVVDERSIVDVTPDELRGFTQCHFFAGIGVWSYALRSAGWADDRPVWTGSCPCQPFSAAGARGGFDDQRHLWPHWHHLISQCRPSVVFGEQVASKDGLGWLDLVHADMEATGYAFGAADLCAAGVGAPHIRQRLWFVGMADASGERHDGQQVRLQSGQPRQEGAEAAGSGGRSKLADAADAGLQIGRGGSGGEPGSVEQPERLRADGGLADAGCDSARSQLGNRAETQGVPKAECKPEQRADVSDGCSAGGDGRGVHRSDGIDASRLADADGNGRHESLQSVSGGSSERAGSGGINHGLGNADDQGSQEHGGSGNIHLRQPDGQDQGRQHIDAGMDVRAPQQPSPTNGFWRDADWLFCRDGKWRPVEPSTFPLAHGSPARVGRLRGYGNAIAAPVAQTFIKSVMEILE